MYVFLFALTDVGQVAHPIAWLVRWVEPGCKGGRSELPLTIESPGLTLYLPYIYIHIYTANWHLSCIIATRCVPVRCYDILKFGSK
jgi:hypothetical protein